MSGGSWDYFSYNLEEVADKMLDQAELAAEKEVTEIRAAIAKLRDQLTEILREP